MKVKCASKTEIPSSEILTSFKHFIALVLFGAILIDSVTPALAQFSSAGAKQISVNAQGSAPDGFSGEVSAAPNGELSAFASSSTNLLPNDTNGVPDVFSYHPTKGLELISVSAVSGTFPTAESGALGSGAPAISSILPDGSYAVAFTSDSKDIVPNYQSPGLSSGNPRQVYLRLPSLNKTILISLARDSSASVPRGANEPCDQVSVVALADPTRYVVVFRSAAPNLRDGPPTPQPARSIHITTVAFENSEPKIVRQEAIDRLPSGDPINSDLNHPAISGDGRLIAFSSVAPLATGINSNNKEQVFIFDRGSKVAKLISLNQSGNPGNNDSFHPSLSFQGEFLAFITRANDIIPRPTTGPIAVLFNSRTKAIAQVNTAADGTASNGNSYYARVSPGGKLVTFADDGSNLVASPSTSGLVQTYIKDPKTGSIFLTSSNAAGVAGDGNSGAVPPALAPNASALYRPLAFGSLGFSSPAIFTVFRSAAQNLTTVGTSSETLPNVFRTAITPPKPKFEKNAPIEAPPDVTIVSSLPNGRGASITIQLQEFEDTSSSAAKSEEVNVSATTSSKLKYNIEIRKSASRTRIFRTTSRNSTTIRKLSPGKYSVRYRVSKISGKTETKSKYSPKTSLEIT